MIASESIFPPLIGSSRGEWSPSRTRTTLERNPPKCRRRGTGCGARWPRCSRRRWIQIQPSGLFFFSFSIVFVLSSASAFLAHALRSSGLISPSSPQSPWHHKDFSWHHYFYSHSACFPFFPPSVSFLFNVDIFSFSKSCLMVRTDQLSRGTGGEFFFPSSSLHRTWLLSTVCARNTKSGQPLPSSRKRRNLLSKTSLLVSKQVEVLCCTPYNIND